VTYLPHPHTAARIRRHFPDTGLLVLLRNPVKRTFSNYLHAIRKGDIARDQPFSAFIGDR